MNQTLKRCMALLLAALFLTLGCIPLAIADEVQSFDTETGFPLLEMVQSELDADEILTTEDVTLTAGEELDLIDPLWLETVNGEPAKFTLELVKITGDHEFLSDMPGSYTAFYVVMPLSGHMAYEISRRIHILPPDTKPTDETEDDIPDDSTDTEIPPDGETVAATETPSETQSTDAASDTTAGATEATALPEDSVVATEEPLSTSEASITGEATTTELPTVTTTTVPVAATEAPAATINPTIEPSTEPIRTDTPIDSGVDSIGVDTTASPEPDATPETTEGPAEDEDEIPPDNIVLEGPAKMSRGSKITYPGNLGNWSTFKYTVDGKIAYCLESSKASPKNGSFAQEILDSNSNLTKTLYYGYGGPGDVSAVYYPNYSDNIRYILTHIAASYSYTGSLSQATKGCYASGLTRYDVSGWIDYLSNLPDPPSPRIGLSDTMLAVAEVQDGRQITQTSTLKADERNSITVMLPDDVTFHNQTGETQTGGAVEITGGTTFFFSAPTSVSGTWSIDDLRGSIEKTWKVIVVKTGTKTQDMGSYASETYGTGVSFSVEWLNECELKVMKTDAEDSNVLLNGAVFGVYSDEACTQQQATMTTGEDGIAVCKLQRIADTVYVKELTAPDGYRLNRTVYAVDLTGDASVTMLVKDEKQSAGLKITKKGEVLTGANVTASGVEFLYELRRLEGAVYRVTADSNIYNADGSLRYQKGASVADQLTTNADGIVMLNDLPLGSYRIEETQAPDGYVLAEEAHTVTLAYAGQEADVAFDETTFNNERQKAAVCVLKQDAESDQPLSGAEFVLYSENDILSAAGELLIPAGTLLEKAVTSADGTADFTVDLPQGYAYCVKESKAPAGYLADGGVFTFSFTAVDQLVPVAEYSSVFEDSPIKASVKLTKVDSETGTPQGDANLSGAVYGLYARENITSPDGRGEILFLQDELVTTLTTDTNGMASVGNLYPGSYYLREITPSIGYVLDTLEYDADCTQGDGAEIMVSCTVKEHVMKQPFQIIKAVSNGQSNAALLDGAGFTAWLVSDLARNSDGGYDFASATPVALGANGAKEIFTDKKGYAVTIPLPYGTYIVRETTTPHNYMPVADFTITISENMPDTPQVWRVLLDEEFSAKLKLIKIDAATRRTVLLAGAEFSVYDIDRQKPVTQVTSYPQTTTHSTFRTDESGTLTLPKALEPGRYRITEISAPDGYLLNPVPVEIAIGEDSPYRIDALTNEPVIEVVMQDTAAKGQITVCKEGEILTGYQDGRFIYENRRLAGVSFEVYALEDIYTADHQKDENGNRYIEFAKGTLVETLTTDSDGMATTAALPFGRYSVIEKQTSDGFALDSEPHEVTLAYTDQQTEIVTETVTLTNQRQKVSVSAEKLSADGKARLSGAEFALYAGEAIHAGDTELAAAGTCLASGTTDATGMLTFDIDLPLGRYLIQETKAPAGYLLSDEVHEIDASYQGQTVETVVISEQFKNEPVHVAISKADATTGVELDGAKMSLMDEAGNAIDTWVSVAGSPHIIEGLTIGATYTLREEIAPYGYLLANTVKFTVADTAEIQQVVMKDEVPTGTIIINKSGEFLSSVSVLDSAGGWIGNAFDYITGGLQNVTFNVYAAEAIHAADGASPDYFAADAPVGTMTTDSSGVAKLENLPLGRYCVREAETQSGYVLDDQTRLIDLSYRDSSTAVVTYSEAWQNERRRLNVQLRKLEEGTDKLLAGAAFGLYAGEDITAGGKVVLKKDSLIEQRVTDANGLLCFETDLPAGFSYYVKEVLPPSGYASDPEPQLFFFDPDADQATAVQELVFTDEKTKLKISKTDIGGKELEGAKLSILNSKGETVAGWTSGKEPHYIEMLPIGRYTLHEESAPDGYLIAEDMTFEVKDTGEIQSITMRDEAKTTDNSGGGSDTPKTGDERKPILWVCCTLAGCLGLIALIFINRKRRG